MHGSGLHAADPPQRPGSAHRKRRRRMEGGAGFLTHARRTDSSSSSGSDSDSGCYSGSDSTATWPQRGRRERGGLVVVSRSIDDLSEDDNLPQLFPECRGPTAAVSEASARSDYLKKTLSHPTIKF